MHAALAVQAQDPGLRRCNRGVRDPNARDLIVEL
jgi:hypothetical protein